MNIFEGVGTDGTMLPWRVETPIETASRKLKQLFHDMFELDRFSSPEMIVESSELSEQFEKIHFVVMSSHGIGTKGGPVFLPENYLYFMLFEHSGELLPSLYIPDTTFNRIVQDEDLPLPTPADVLIWTWEVTECLTHVPQEEIANINTLAVDLKKIRSSKYWMEDGITRFASLRLFED